MTVLIAYHRADCKSPYDRCDCPRWVEVDEDEPEHEEVATLDADPAEKDGDDSTK